MAEILSEIVGGIMSDHTAPANVNKTPASVDIAKTDVNEITTPAIPKSLTDAAHASQLAKDATPAPIDEILHKFAGCGYPHPHYMYCQWCDTLPEAKAALQATILSEKSNTFIAPTHGVPVDKIQALFGGEQHVSNT